MLEEAGGLAVPPSWRQCPQSSPRAFAWRLPHCCDLFVTFPRRQWIRLSSRNSFASYSRIERRNVLPAELDQLSQLPASHTTKDEGKPRDWVRERRRGRAGGRRGRMHFRRRGWRNLKGTQWSQRTCCGVEESGLGESRCCCGTSLRVSDLTRNLEMRKVC